MRQDVSDHSKNLNPRKSPNKCGLIVVLILFFAVLGTTVSARQTDAPVARTNAEARATASQPAGDVIETETVVPGQSFEGIRAIPKKTRILYGGIAIGGLLALVIILRLLKKKST
jgi:hypothetical protein